MFLFLFSIQISMHLSS